MDNKRIVSELRAIERGHSCQVLLAVESGSRAWGFPSPDSDWDVRFIYAHNVQRYLSIGQTRDVIEYPHLPDDLDLSGWDIRKALSLMLAGNSTVREWMNSPIGYFVNSEFFTDLSELAKLSENRSAALYHYRAMIDQIKRKYMADPETVNLKRYLYVVRPALCILWMREHACGFPPMDVRELLTGTGLQLSQDERDAISALLMAKATASELGHGRRVRVLDAMVDRAWDYAKAESGKGATVPNPEAVALANHIIFKYVGK
jgi:hypothetical protein